MRARHGLSLLAVSAALGAWASAPTAPEPAGTAAAPVYTHRLVSLEPVLVKQSEEKNAVRYTHKKISMKLVPWKKKPAAPAKN